MRWLVGRNGLMWACRQGGLVGGSGSGGPAIPQAVPACLGSLKDLASEYQVSYPTIRGRLDRLIAKVQAAEDPRISDPFVRKLQILVADGRCRRPSRESCSKLIDNRDEGERDDDGTVVRCQFVRMDPRHAAGSSLRSLGITRGGVWPRGAGETLVLGSLGILLGCSAICLILGITALVSRQPYGVWYGLLLGGCIRLVVLGSLTPLAIMAYRQAETRKMQARDL